MPSLIPCANYLTDTIYRAVKDFVTTKEFFTRPTNSDNIYAGMFDIPNEYDDDILIWNRFHLKYPEEANELDLALQYCLDKRITRGKYNQENILKDFLMHKFRRIISSLSEIHAAHIKKEPPPNLPSHPAPIWKINQIREKVGLPPLNDTLSTITIQIYA